MMKKRGAGCVRPVVKTEYAVDDFAGRIFLASDRAGSGLDCGDVNFRIFLPEIGRQAAECSASACHQNKGINTSVGILPDLRPGRADMCLRIGRVGCLIKKMEGRPHRRAVAADLFESCLTEWIKGGIRIGGSRKFRSDILWEWPWKPAQSRYCRLFVRRSYPRVRASRLPLQPEA